MVSLLKTNTKKILETATMTGLQLISNKLFTYST